MLTHTIDAMPPTSTFSQAAVITTADARDFSRGTGGPIASDWRVAEVPGVDGLCFVRRGTGDWKGVITVCEGRVATLGSRQQQAHLQPAVMPVSSGSAAASTPATETSGSTLWQQLAAGVLMVLGLGLAVKSGAMLMEGTRRYG